MALVGFTNGWICSSQQNKKFRPKKDEIQSKKQTKYYMSLTWRK